MASLHKDRKSSNFSIRFRYEGRNINRSLRTSDKRKAAGICSRIEETLLLLEGGRIEIPASTEPLDFIFSDGKKTGKTVSTKTKHWGLTEFCAIYEQRLPQGHKEASTLHGERIHFNHLQRHLGPNRKVQFITKANLQEYVAKRLQDTHHGKPIQPDTVRKELVTFRMLWNWGVQEDLLTGPSPTKHVVFPLTDEKPPFMTCQEIERIIARGGLTEAEERRLWESVYLETSEVGEVLEYIRNNARYPFIYPMMVFVAHTSARRSEMVRSLIEDIDFRSRTVVLREKKKSRTKAMTFRRVDMSPLLYRVLQEWIQNHPGGQQTFCQLRGFQQALPLTVWQAHYHLKQTVSNSDWSFLTGFHIFRHSFASNLAAAEVDQRVIDEFMGHQTEEMRRRYRHLFPAQRRAAIESIFGEEDDRNQGSLAS
ncbi:site-specific tyrosine recombinase XerD [Polystyrenella longa]|uniref:Site-specific tyrosine recombinase XerD n=1 Tax=Polystyrenella longa TaxID=2528007 RepID=A0A518CNE3_9PLAN|nr:tyrosine-type recombinase/integrase [Polystyrenella longa]QDU80714.1 site-specific tyrosine recombinase XerD [Polystyrenella longa]